MSAREGASLYLDPATPRLTNRNALDHTNTTQFSPGDSWRWRYLLHPNSNITISTCTADITQDMYILIVQGQDELDSFDSETPSGDWEHCCSVRSVQITDECSDGSKTTVKYNTIATDTYFFVIYNSGDYVQSVNSSWYIERTEYSPSDMAESCTSNSFNESCTLEVPFQSNYTGLLVKNMSEAVDGTNIFAANIFCELRTVTLVVVILAAFVVAMFVSCVCVHVCCQKQCYSSKKSGAYTPLLSGAERHAPTPVNNYPRPDPVPVNNYPRPVPVNNYPRPDPVPVNNYPQPVPVNNYPRPDPVPVNNYPQPDPVPFNNYPRPDPVPVNNYPQFNNQHPQLIINNYPPRARGPNQLYPALHAAM